MKKSLIALAVGAAFAAPAAYADVTLSGSINMGPAFIHAGDGSTNQANSLRATGPVAAKGDSTVGINVNYSNVTIGSMEDLGGGLKLDFAYQITAPTNGNANVQNRNSHIGLVSDSWGGVWWGSNEQLYERYYYTVDPLDGAAGMGGNLQMLGTPGYGVVFDAPNGAGQYGPATPNAGFYRRVEDALWYDSPNWNGFTFGVYTMLPAFKSTSPVTGTTLNPSIYGGGAKYVSPAIPIQAWVAYEHHKDFFGLNAITGVANGTNSSDHGIQFGVGYTLGDIFGYVNFEQLKYSNDGLAGPTPSEYKRNAFSLGVKWNIPTGYVGGQFIKANNGSCEMADGSGCNADKTGGYMLGIGYYHTLSKQTQAYIMGTYVHNDELNKYSLAGGGSNAGPGVAGGLGSKIYGATIGLKHSF